MSPEKFVGRLKPAAWSRGEVAEGEGQRKRTEEAPRRHQKRLKPAVCFLFIRTMRGGM